MKDSLKLSLAAAVAVIVIGFVVVEVRNARHNGQKTVKVWFYDESEKELYAAPVNTLPPDKGIGGPGGDGVRATVITFPSEKLDPKKRKIAYLEKYSPDLRDLLERVAATHAVGRIFAGYVPSHGSAFFQDHTLVKKVDESDWHPATSPEGHTILTEWRTWRGPNGERPIVSTP